MYSKKMVYIETEPRCLWTPSLKPFEQHRWKPKVVIHDANFVVTGGTAENFGAISGDIIGSMMTLCSTT